jgi:hypothetical protein
MAKPTYTTPVLDSAWTHYANIVSAVPFTENTGTPADLVGGNTVTFTTCSWTTADGSSAICVSKDGDASVLGVDVVVPTPGSVIIIYDPGTGFSGSSDSFWGTSVANEIGVRRASGNTRLMWGETEVINVSMGTDWYTLSQDQVCVATCDSSDSLIRLGATEYTGTGDADGHTGDFRIQEGYGAADNGCQILGWVILDTKLSSAQASAIEASPWAWLKEGAGASTVTPDEFYKTLLSNGGL